MPFGVVSGVGSFIGVLDGGPYPARRRGSFRAFGVGLLSIVLNDVLEFIHKRECNRLVREKKYNMSIPYQWKRCLFVPLKTM